MKIQIGESDLRSVLEALEEIHPGNMTPIAEEAWNKAITALREALAEQPAQQEEPLTQDMVESCPYHGETLRGAFFDGWIKAEAAHGIKEKNT